MPGGLCSAGDQRADGRPPPPPALLPPRLAIASVPLAAHSVKPPLDAQLKRVARHLLGQPPSAADEDDELTEEQAWRALPKVELFAREVRPHWHAAGDEVLHHQHEGFYREAGP